MTIGEMLRSFLTKLEWFSTLFPRIPVQFRRILISRLKLDLGKSRKTERKVLRK